MFVCLFDCLIDGLMDFYFLFYVFENVFWFLHGVIERVCDEAPYIDRYKSHSLERVKGNSEGRFIKEGRGCKNCKYMTRKGNHALLQR